LILGVENERGPDVGAQGELKGRRELGTARKGETGRHDARDRERLAGKIDLLADDGRISAEPPPPQVMADRGDVPGTG
jgi:hypothetical protein